MGRTQRGIARMVGLDRKTVARYPTAAKAAGASQDGHDVTQEQLAAQVVSPCPGFEMPPTAGSAPTGHNPGLGSGSPFDRH